MHVAEDAERLEPEACCLGAVGAELQDPQRICSGCVQPSIARGARFSVDVDARHGSANRRS